jgi:hypothetical protein
LLTVRTFAGEEKLEEQGTFESALLPDDAACGGLPAYPGMITNRQPCWRVSMIPHRQPERLRAVTRGLLEREGLPGGRPITYIVSTRGQTITLRPTRPDGTPFHPYDADAIRSREWVLEPVP